MLAQYTAGEAARPRCNFKYAYQDGNTWRELDNPYYFVPRYLPDFIGLRAGSFPTYDWEGDRCVAPVLQSRNLTRAVWGILTTRNAIPEGISETSMGESTTFIQNKPYSYRAPRWAPL